MEETQRPRHASPTPARTRPAPKLPSPPPWPSCPLIRFEAREVAQGGLCDLDALKSTADDSGAWKAVGGTDVAADVCDPSDDQGDRGRVSRLVARGLTQHDDCIDLILRELDAGRLVRLVASEVFQPLDAYGHGGQECSPTLNVLHVVELDGLDAAVGLPAAMEILDTPAQRSNRSGVAASRVGELAAVGGLR